MAQFLKKTVKPSGGDYTTLDACMNANEQDLTGDGWFDVEIDGDWTGAPDTEPVTIHNYTTTAADYINIYTTGDARHDGKRYGSKASAYALKRITGYIDWIMTIGAKYVTLDGLQIVGINPSYAPQGISLGSVKGCTIKNCIFYKLWDRAINIYNEDWGGTIKIYNNVFHDTHKGVWNQWGPTEIYNNTFYLCRVGIDDDSGISGTIIKNNLSIDSTTADYQISAQATTANNLSGDDSSPNEDFRNKEIDFVSKSEGSEDFHLAETDTDAIGQGVDLSAIFTDDIDGDTRSAPWSIGADAPVSANLYPTALLKKGLVSGFHAFVSQYILATGAGYDPLKLPDGTGW